MSALSQLTLANRPGWSEPRAKLDTAQPSGLVGAWRFGKYAPDSDGDALKRAAYNKAAGGPRGIANRLIGGAPVVANDYFGFTGGILGAGDWVRTGIFEAATFCLYAVCRTQETSISGASIPFVCGHYAQNNGLGIGLLWATVSQMRLWAYDTSGAGGAAALKTTSLTIPSSTQDKWRVIYAHGTPSELKIVNLTGDSTTNEPAVTAISGRYLGARPFSIGSAHDSLMGKRADIHAVRLYQGVTHDATQRAAVLAELRASAGTLTF